MCRKENTLLMIATILFVSCLSVFLPAGAFAYTEIPGGTICTTSWGPGTVFVTGSVTVSDDCTLTILPKTIVKFSPARHLTVYGTLVAEGSVTDEIVFTSRDDNTFGEIVSGSDGSSSPGDWYGIYLNGTSVNDGIGNFDYCRVRFGGNTTGSADANIRFYNSDSGSFTNCISEFSDFRGLWIDSASPIISNSIFRNNTNHGLHATGSGTPTITDNTFNDNGQYAVYLNQTAISPLCDNNSGSGNGLDGLAVSGNVAADQAWSFGSDGFPIVVINSVTVADGVTLTIPAGAVVKFRSGRHLTVYGALQAVGASDQWIVFTSLQDDAYGGDTNADSNATEPSRGDWYGIYLNGTSANDGIGNFDYCRVRFGGNTTGSADANIRFYNSDSGNFTNSISEFSDFYGLWIDSASPIISNSIFRNNTNHGLFASGSGAPTIIDNTFNDNDEYAVYLSQGAISPLCDNNSGSGNGLDGLAVSGNVAADQAWSFGSDGFPIVVINSVTVADGVTLTIPAGAVVKFRSGRHLTVYGALQAVGASDQWIVFTSLRDDAYGGDTNADGNATEPSRGDWYGIYLNGTSANDGIGNFDYCRVRFGGNTTGSADANIRFYNSDSGNFTNSISEFSDFYGLWIDSASPIISNSIFRNNTNHGLFASGSGAPTIIDNTFNDNDEYAVYLSQGAISPLCDNNSGSGNGLDGLAVSGNVAADQAWSFGSDGFPIVVINSVTVTDGVTLTIPAGAVVKFRSGRHLTVYGALQAVGASDQWIVFTSLQDDAYGGDTNADGNSTEPFRGDWHGIYLNGTSANDGIGNFDYCRLRYGGDTVGNANANLRFYNSDSGNFTNSISEFSEFSGVGIDNASPLISNTTISKNSQYGIYCYQSSSRIINTIIWGNTDAIYTGGSASPNVEYCNIEGGYPGDTNIDVDPLFIDFAGDNYRLFHCSPAVDAGDPAERLSTNYTSGETILSVEAVTNVVADDFISITDGVNIDSDTVVSTTMSSISIFNGFSNSYPASDDVSVFTRMSDYSNEPEPNGGRINMGAFGGTAEAARTFKMAGDIDGDGDTDGVDLGLFALRYGDVGCGGCPEDINCDNDVDETDLKNIAGNFGKSI